MINRDIELVPKVEKFTTEPKNIIYDNFRLKVINNNYDKIEKDYIIEACNCGINGNKLATATMIGCASERLLILLCEAYSKYLKQNASDREYLMKKF